MDFSLSNLWSSLMISCLGMAFFMYGKKAQRPFPLIAGIAMSVYPFFIASLLLLWLTTGGLLAALYFTRQQ
jgi:hypothetical protein